MRFARHMFHVKPAAESRILFSRPQVQSSRRAADVSSVEGGILERQFHLQASESTTVLFGLIWHFSTVRAQHPGDERVTTGTGGFAVPEVGSRGYGIR